MKSPERTTPPRDLQNYEQTQLYYTAAAADAQKWIVYGTITQI